jgi:EmrB/QacA subfamily drug resistance transporter
MHHHAVHAPHRPDQHERRRPWTVLGLMLAAQFMVVLDISVVNVALPTIGADLSLSASSYQWVVSAYVLLSGGLLLLGGRMADLVGRRATFLTGLLLFTTASLASGLAESATSLVLARAAQGAGAALLTPGAMAIVMTSYDGKQRVTALSVWGTIASLGIAAGVLFGGLLTSAFDWRAVFFVNVPIGIAVLVGVLHTVPSTGGVRRPLRGLDLPGAFTLVGGLLLLVNAVQSTTSHGWTAVGTVVCAAGGVLLLVAFALVERRATQPLVDPHIWRLTSLVSGSTVMAGITGAVVGVMFLSSLYLHQVLGSSAVVTGLQFLPLAAAITLGAAAASHAIGHLGPRALIANGLVVSAVGALLLAHGGGDPSYVVDVLPGFVVMGLGIGPVFVAVSVAAMSDVPEHAAGLASGLMMTGHEVGAALGVASLTAVAGDITTRAGLVAGHGDAFVAVAVVLLALLVPTALVPRRVAGGAVMHLHH